MPVATLVEAGQGTGDPALGRDSFQSDPQIVARLKTFLDRADLLGRGGVMTDLDGTAVLERDGIVMIPEAVSRPLTDLAALGCRVMLNTLRFPLNVIRTFGRAWFAFSHKTIPLVSLNGSVIGYIKEGPDETVTFHEIAAFPLLESDVARTVDGIEALLAGGIDDLLLFFYPRDWREGEHIWTPTPHRVESTRLRYPSASQIVSTGVADLRRMLKGHEPCMMLLLVHAAEDRLMAYQHVHRAGFVTRPGVDKASGARALAAITGVDLSHSIGAGDTPVDSFLSVVGLAMQVGGLAIPYQGLSDTLNVPDPLALGAALHDVALLSRKRQ